MRNGILILVILYIIGKPQPNSTDDSSVSEKIEDTGQWDNLFKNLNAIDPNVVDENDILWHQLFNKINTILKETANQSENIEKLKIRQREHDQKLAEFMEKTQTQLMDLKNLIGGYKNHIEDFKKGQDDQKSIINQLMQNVEHNFKDLQKGQQDHKEFLNETKSHFEKNEKGQALYGTNLITNHNMSNYNEWITILRRQDGSVEFNRNWTEYKFGFGNPNGEFFIGLEKLHKLTTEGASKELMIILSDSVNDTRTAKYDHFLIGNESEKYILKKLGAYSGNAGDSLRIHEGMLFSTYDQDNDVSVTHCGLNFNGGWWFRNCYESYLCGEYGKQIHWQQWKSTSLKYVEMKIRSKFSGKD